MRILRSTLPAALLAALLVACGGTAPASAPAQPAAAGAQEAGAAPTPPPADTALPPTATPEPTVASTATPEPTATPIPAEPGTSRSAPLPLGTELRFTDWAVTITGVSRGEEAAAAIAAANQFNEPAPEGQQYLLASLKLTNISTEQEAKSVLFAIDLRVTGARNILYSRASGVVPQPLEGELFPEGSAEGQIAFLVPADETNLQFFVAESLSFEPDARRFVAIDEGASLTPEPGLADLAPEEAGSRRAEPAPLTTRVRSEDWEVEIGEVFRGAEAAERITAANQFNEPAPEGQEYIVAWVGVRYIGMDDADAAASVDQNAFKVTGASNVVYDRPSVVAPAPQLDASLFPGGQTTGWVVVQVPTGEAGLALVFEPLFSFDDANIRFLGLE